MFRAVRDNLYSTLFPAVCLCCGASITTPSLGNACADCWNQTNIFDECLPLCNKCGRPEPSASRLKCWQCDGHEYDRARSLGIYSFALKAAVVGLKTQPHLSPKLRQLLAEAFDKNGFADSTLIVAVPLSRQRKLERGFNQAEVIAQALGRTAGISVDAHSLVRTKHSPIHRAGMDEKARDLSVKNSFDVARPKLIDGQSVLLIDDVLTTGATASYCAKALKRCGASAINVLTLARAV